jgi:hypothetical protein
MTEMSTALLAYARKTQNTNTCLNRMYGKPAFSRIFIAVLIFAGCVQYRNAHRSVWVDVGMPHFSLKLGRISGRLVSEHDIPASLAEAMDILLEMTSAL